MITLNPLLTSVTVSKRDMARRLLPARSCEIVDHVAHEPLQARAAEAIRALVERCEPTAEALGCAEELEFVEAILGRGNGADDQLRVYRETDSLRDAAETVARETAPQGVLTS